MLLGAGAYADAVSQADNFWQADTERGVYTKVFPVIQRNAYTLLLKTGKYLCAKLFRVVSEGLET